METTGTERTSLVLGNTPRLGVYLRRSWNVSTLRERPGRARKPLIS
jgi:hypothetical protein